MKSSDSVNTAVFAPTFAAAWFTSEFCYCLLCFFFIRRLAMPACLVFHERNAASLVGFCDDNGRLALAGARFVKGRENLPEVMAVNRNGMEAERPEFFIDRRDCHDILVFTVDLQTVPVHDRAEVVQLVVRGSHRRLPDKPLLQLAITKQRIHSAGRFAGGFVHLTRHRHADRY